MRRFPQPLGGKCLWEFPQSTQHNPREKTVNITDIHSRAGFMAYTNEIMGDPSYPGVPQAGALGVATRHIESGKLLDVRFAEGDGGVNFGDAALGAARSLALFWAAARYEGLDVKTPGLVITVEMVDALVRAFDPFLGDGESHPNIEALHELIQLRSEMNEKSPPLPGHEYVIVLAWTQDLKQEPQDMPDVWLRLTMTSRRMVLPNTASLSGKMFGLLPNVKWTTRGPAYEMSANRLAVSGATVLSQDKLPQMLWYVDNGDVRIVSSASVRLGAYLAPGTTVMPAGYVNFNAGTLGVSMVEGRISQGVVVGAGTDVGGGSSFMGTMSGGNRIKVSMGMNCLLEALAGLGIPVGDRVRVVAGFYLKSTSLVALDSTMWSGVSQVESIGIDDIVGVTDDGRIVVKALVLAGISDAIFRRNDRTGITEVIPRGDSIWGTLTPELHANANS